MNDSTIDAAFLGPYGENDTLLEKIVVEFLRDHVCWRRNFHPEDPPAISTLAAQHPDFHAFEARLRRELHSLSAALKRSVPFHSPRYMGHMVSDLLLPGLAAQMLTLPYNPNNVSEDAAPVTIDLELKAGLQLAAMLGYPTDTQKDDCAFGHLTSGGTVANYQALRLALAIKAFPVALRAADPPGLPLPSDDWAAFNLGPRAGLELLRRWQEWLANLAPTERAMWNNRVHCERLESLGIAGFYARHHALSPPVVLAPSTAHYSWKKGMKLLGLGEDQLRFVPENAMRMCSEALEDALYHLRQQRQSVLMCVGVLGTTEFGTVDPIDHLIEARDRHAATGFGFSVHVDAAWGGYLASVLRNTDGGLRGISDVRKQFGQFPSTEVHAAFAATGQADSITVDPHKMGFVPYGAGAFLCRDQRGMALLAENADYVFGPAVRDDYFSRFGKLGRYSLEGSKSGAAAAAVYVTHRVLPLDHLHLGRILGETIHNAAAFMRRAARFATECSDVLHVRVPYAPDTNLVCLALNPLGHHSVAAMNAFVGKLQQELRSDPTQPLQAREFFASVTTLRPEALGPADLRRVLGELDLDAETLLPDHEGADRLLILRHTLMNPFLTDTANGISYIDRYFEFLERRVRALLNAPALAA